MSNEDYGAVAKKLGIRFRLWKWGVNFQPKDPLGHSYKLFKITPLSGWIFDPHEIVQAMADDPAFSISYKDKKL